MRTVHRKLRFGSVISVGISSLVTLYVSYRFASTVGAWSIVATGEKVIWSLALVGAFALLISSVLYTATGARWIGVSHGVLMALVAGVISFVSIHSLIDLQSHPRGGFVEMAAVPILGGLLVFGIFAGGSTLQTFASVAKKEPNQSLQPTAPSGRG